MRLDGYRVSYHDMQYNHGVESQERIGAMIDDINKQASSTSRKPDIVIAYVSAKHFGVLQGHSYDYLRKHGGSLSKYSADNPFDGTFHKCLYYNAAFSGAARVSTRLLDDWDPVTYILKPDNAVQLESPPGALPERHDVKDIMIEMEKASQECRFAREGVSDTAEKESLYLGKSASQPSSGVMQ